MYRQFCKSKIQGLVVTETDLYYEGSITLDPELADAADIRPWEMVQVLNLNNGERIFTYYIPGSREGVVCLNGPAARRFEVGDRVIVLSTVFLVPEEADAFDAPVVVSVDDRNRLTGKS